VSNTSNWLVCSPRWQWPETLDLKSKRVCRSVATPLSYPHWIFIKKLVTKHPIHQCFTTCLPKSYSQCSISFWLMFIWYDGIVLIVHELMFTNLGIKIDFAGFDQSSMFSTLIYGFYHILAWKATRIYWGKPVSVASHRSASGSKAPIGFPAFVGKNLRLWDVTYSSKMFEI
jgi:hypothetical protein